MTQEFRNRMAGLIPSSGIPKKPLDNRSALFTADFTYVGLIVRLEADRVEEI